MIIRNTQPSSSEPEPCRVGGNATARLREIVSSSKGKGRERKGEEETEGKERERGNKYQTGAVFIENKRENQIKEKEEGGGKVTLDRKFEHDENAGCI